MSQNKEENIINFIKETGVLSGKTTEATTIQLLVIDNAFNAYRTQTSKGIQDSMVEYFLLPIAKRIVEGSEEGLTFEPYDPNHAPDPLIVWKKDASSVDNYTTIAQQILGNMDELPVFSDNTSSIDTVGSLAALVSTGEKSMIIFQQFLQRSVLKNSTRLKIGFEGVSFKEIEDQAVFQLSRENHVVAYDDELLILDRKPFEAIFRYQEQKRDIANAKLDEIEKKYSSLILLPADKSLRDLISGDSPTVNKLLTLRVDDLSEPNETAYDINEEYSVGLEIDDNTGKMCVTNKKEAKSFISLVNDDFLQSPMTERKYATQSKKKIKTQ